MFSTFVNVGIRAQPIKWHPKRVLTYGFKNHHGFLFRQNERNMTKSPIFQGTTDVTALSDTNGIFQYHRDTIFFFCDGKLFKNICGIFLPTKGDVSLLKRHPKKTNPLPCYFWRTIILEWMLVYVFIFRNLFLHDAKQIHKSLFHVLPIPLDFPFESKTTKYVLSKVHV